jgi:hypothetical protein
LGALVGSASIACCASAFIFALSVLGLTTCAAAKAVVTGGAAGVDVGFAAGGVTPATGGLVSVAPLAVPAPLGPGGSRPSSTAGKGGSPASNLA